MVIPVVCFKLYTAHSRNIIIYRICIKSVETFDTVKTVKQIVCCDFRRYQQNTKCRLLFLITIKVCCQFEQEVIGFPFFKLCGPCPCDMPLVTVTKWDGRDVAAIAWRRAWRLMFRPDNCTSSTFIIHLRWGKVPISIFKSFLRELLILAITTGVVKVHRWT